jgi:hypothetical protein
MWVITEVIAFQNNHRDRRPNYTNLVGICGWNFRRTPALRDCPIPQDKPQLRLSRAELEQNVKYLMAKESSYLTLL